jgi:hypothetical protein
MYVGTEVIFTKDIQLYMCKYYKSSIILKCDTSITVHFEVIQYLPCTWEVFFCFYSYTLFAFGRFFYFIFFLYSYALFA